MSASTKTARIRIALFIVGLMVAASVLVSPPLLGPVQAQGGTPGAGPLKPQQDLASPQALWPHDTYYASQSLVFVPLNSSMAYHNGIGGCRITDTSGDYFASVNIPGGSVVNTLEVVFNNPAGMTTQDSYVGLMYGTDTGSWQALGYVDFTYVTSGVHIQQVSLNGATINTYNNAYVFMWRGIAGGSQLCQVRLYYRQPILLATYLPTVIR